MYGNVWQMQRDGECALGFETGLVNLLQGLVESSVGIVNIPGSRIAFIILFFCSGTALKATRCAGKVLCGAVASLSQTPRIAR